MMLQVSSSPHIRDNSSTRGVMIDVVISLIPSLLAGIYFFGYQALLVVVLSVGSAILFEYISRRVMKKDNTIGDFSAVVTGLLLAFNLPPSVPVWLPIIGSAVAIVVVKQMFGGLGHNFVNPALAARIVLTLSFPAPMTRWIVKTSFDLFSGTDLIATATPLYLAQSGNPDNLVVPTYLELFLGLKGGCIGEVSILALAIGAAYLLLRKVISPWIPLTYLATVAAVTAAFGQDPLYHLLSGGLMIGAFFMATDYVTAPLSRKGKIIFGIGCGLLTALLRIFGSMSGGVSFAIIFMNILTPHLDRWTIPVPFGGVRRAKS